MGFGPGVNISIFFKGNEDNPTTTVTDDATKTTKELTIFQGGDDIKGTVKVDAPQGKPVEHIGIKVELFGQIECKVGGGSTQEFLSLVRELAPPSTLSGSKTYSFDFSKVDKQYESYKGTQAYLRYFVRATVTRNGFNQTVSRERDFWVQNLQKPPEINPSIKMEVGIEECLHIEFEYDKSKYHMKDVVSSYS